MHKERLFLRVDFVMEQDRQLMVEALHSYFKSSRVLATIDLPLACHPCCG
jgi:hypothetical protein